MKELLYFYLPGCPHCKLATSYLEQLQAESPEYAQIAVKRIDELREKALAGRYDYWYVPSFWYDGQKLHEGHAELADVRRALDRALE